MPQKCQITGRKTMSGNRVSHSKVKARRKFRPNLHTKKIINPASGKPMKITLSTRAMRTLAKWQMEGKIVDIKKLINT